jgi:predicted Zn-dependent protease
MKHLLGNNIVTTMLKNYRWLINGALTLFVLLFLRYHYVNHNTTTVLVPPTIRPKAVPVNYEGRPLSPPPKLKGHGEVYFVPINTSHELLQDFAYYYKNHLGIKITVLPTINIPNSAIDVVVRQVNGDDLLKYMREKYPEKSNSSLIGIVSEDMHPEDPNFCYVFSLREMDYTKGTVIISSARMRPEFWGEQSDKKLFHSRLTKMITRNLGIIYYRLPDSKDPESVLYSPIMSIDDLDRVGQGF